MNSLTGKNYLGPVCRGSWVLGTACGSCERCKDTRPGIQSQPNFEMEKEFEKIHRMIKAHFEQFGVAPHSVSIPCPILEVEGVRVNFHNAPQYYSIDKDRCLHHDFKGHLK